jgi:hypothetical protein
MTVMVIGGGRVSEEKKVEKVWRSIVMVVQAAVASEGSRSPVSI